jgi:L-alanine-DL-glutamate epimerase-like enolase superfamily enzyme
MLIHEIQACTLVIPLQKRTSFSTRNVDERHYTVVRIRDGAGLEGYGYCYSGNKAGHLVTLSVRDLLSDLLVGRESYHVEAIWQELFRECLLQGRRGAWMRAISAIDIALWDLNAKSAGLPLWKYIGGSRAVTVPAYASGGYYLQGKTPEDLGAEVAGFTDMGFRAVKIKVGRLPPREDARRIDAARKAIGPDVLLFLDANNAWDDLPTAVRAVRMWELWEPGWIEEPFLPDEIDLHAALAAAVRTPVATGEIENGHWGFKMLLDKKAAQILQPDAGVCGGITEWRKIAALAQAYGVSVAPHWLADVHVHLVATAPNATWVELFPDTSVLNVMACFKSQLEIHNGEIVLPTGLGLGIDWDWGAVEKYSIDGWK